MGRKAIADDFNCHCSNPTCDLKERLQAKADILGIGLGTTAFLLSTLKATASATPVAGLKELSGGLLILVNAIQDKREVKGGFNHIIVDCLRVTCIVCDHARRREGQISQTITRAIKQLLHDLEGIKAYARDMNSRGGLLRLLMGSADKATVGEWRQRLTTSWSLFTTELMMDTNYRVTKDDRANSSVNISELAEKIVQQLAQTRQKDTEQAFSQGHKAIPAQSPLQNSSNATRERDGDDQHPSNKHHSGGYPDSQPGEGGQYADPESYDDRSQASQGRYSQQPRYQQSDNNSFRRRQTEAPQQYYYNQHEDHPYPSGSSNGYDTPVFYPNGRWGNHPGQYDPGYGPGYHPPPPPYRFNTMPAPPPPSINNVGSVKNANFGANYGHIEQTSW